MDLNHQDQFILVNYIHKTQDSHYFKGHINNFKIWNKNRTEKEIKDNINKKNI